MGQVTAPIASAEPNVVEYAVQSMFKGQTLVGAARSTARKLSGHQNMFLGPGVTLVDPKKLEIALWDRLVSIVVKALPKYKQGKEHFALDGTLAQFHQKPALRSELKSRVIRSMGYDPFPGDDVVSEHVSEQFLIREEGRELHAERKPTPLSIARADAEAGRFSTLRIQQENGYWYVGQLVDVPVRAANPSGPQALVFKSVAGPFASRGYAEKVVERALKRAENAGA